LCGEFGCKGFIRAFREHHPTNSSETSRVNGYRYHRVEIKHFLVLQGKLVIGIVSVLVAERADTLPIVSLDSINETAEIASGNIPSHIHRQTDEIARLIRQNGNLHRGGSKGLCLVREAVVIAVMTRAKTDGEGVASQTDDLEASGVVHAGQSGFRFVLHAYIIPSERENVKGKTRK
jgi:hypothetical protein